jgi:carbonic anhydrase
MKFLPELFEANRKWATRHRERDPEFFDRLCEIQAPSYVWVGCSDSRVPANQIVGLAPGELFVHRNVANIVDVNDSNCMAVVQYAVEVLRVGHVIVTGHYGCGGVRAALEGNASGFVREWLAPLEALRVRHQAELEAIEDFEQRWRRFCELNVMEQVAQLQRSEIISRAKGVVVHGWIYDLHDGLLRDLEVTFAV